MKKIKTDWLKDLKTVKSEPEKERLSKQAEILDSNKGYIIKRFR